METKYYMLGTGKHCLFNKRTGTHVEEVKLYEFEYGIRVVRSELIYKLSSTDIEITEAQYNRLRKLALKRLS
jgi:hypothetical protein